MTFIVWSERQELNVGLAVDDHGGKRRLYIHRGFREISGTLTLADRFNSEAGLANEAGYSPA
jgi:hypothetical protein